MGLLRSEKLRRSPIGRLHYIELTSLNDERPSRAALGYLARLFVSRSAAYCMRYFGVKSTLR